MLSSFEEAGEQLFTFLRYPVSQWKALGTVDSEAVEATHHRPQFTRFSLLSNQTQRTSPVLARYTTQPLSAQSSWSSRGQRKNGVTGFDCCRGGAGREAVPRR